MAVRARSFAVALAGAIIAGLGTPGGASAHESEWCGHSTLTGNYWHLEYAGYRNEPPDNTTGGAQARKHWHYVDHYYRSNPNAGSFNYRHTPRPVCGYVNNNTPDGGHSGVHLPQAPIDPTDLPETQLVMLQQTAMTTFTGAAPVYEAVPVLVPPAGSCLVSVVNTFDPDAGAVTAGLVNEYAMPYVAAALGHSCLG